MVGVALITGVNVVLASAVGSMHKRADTMVTVDLIIAGELGEGAPPTFDPAVLERARTIPGVRDVVGQYADLALVDGEQTRVDAVTDLPTRRRMFPMNTVEGTLGTLAADDLVVDAKEATRRGLHAGSTVRVQLATGPARTMTVAGVYSSDVYGGWC